jgi:hypothetical protein
VRGQTAVYRRLVLIDGMVTSLSSGKGELEAIYVAVRPIMASSGPGFGSAAFEPVPQTHVRLILLDDADSPFYLEIPIPVINHLCLKPRKYLVFLGWCVLGIDGVLAVDSDGGDEINTDGILDAGGTYYYVTDIDEATGGFLKNAVAIPRGRETLTLRPVQ